MNALVAVGTVVVVSGIVFIAVKVYLRFKE